MAPAGKKMVYALQKVSCRGSEITVKVDLSLEKTIFSPDLKKRFSKNVNILFPTGTEIEFLPAENFGENISEKNLIILGQDYLKNTLIIPETAPDMSAKISTKYPQEIVEIDEKLFELGKKLSFSFLSRPVNYTAELEKFLEFPHQYNPVFEYNFPDAEKISQIEKEIEIIQNDISLLDEKEKIFAKIFEEKLAEYRDNFALILAYKNENHTEIARLNEKIFGVFDEKLLKDSTKKVLEKVKIDAKEQKKLLGEVFSREELVTEIKAYLKENNFEEVPILISNNTISRMAVAYKKNSAHINISSTAEIRKNELPAILAHEVGVHLRRYLNGKKSDLKIFQYGTGYYLRDEEGFAIYNSLGFLPE